MPVLLASVLAVVQPVLMDLVVAWLPLSPGDSPSFTSHMNILQRSYWLAVVVVVLSYAWKLEQLLLLVLNSLE